MINKNEKRLGLIGHTQRRSDDGIAMQVLYTEDITRPQRKKLIMVYCILSLDLLYSMSWKSYNTIGYYTQR